LNIFDKTGKAFFNFVRYILVLFTLFYLSLKVLWTNRKLGHREFFRQVLLQIYFTGIQAILPILVLALLVGTFAIISAMGGAAFSGAEQVGRVVTVVLIRELAPLLTGSIIIARSITAITTELGTMRVQREIEALEAMGISPIHHLITPRLVGGVLSFAALTVFFGFVALISGFLIAQTMVPIPIELFVHFVFSAVQPTDIPALSIKVLGGGAGMFIIACYHGLSVRRASTEVPVAVSTAALNAFIFLIALHVGVSASMFLRSNSFELLGVVL